MPSLVAIDLSPDEVTFVTAVASRTEGVSIVGAVRRRLCDILPEGNLIGSSNTAGTPPSESEINSTEQPHSDSNGSSINASSDGLTPTNRLPAAELHLESLINHEVDRSFATIGSHKALFQYLRLPFQDQRRVDQISPLQVQDLLPFDIDDFIIDNHVVGQEPGGEYEILSSLIPEQEIASAIGTLDRLGAAPRVITTKASAISSLPALFPEELTGDFGILLFEPSQLALAVFLRDELKLVREIPLDRSAGDNLTVYQQVFRDLRCSLARVRQEHQVELSRLFLIGSTEFAAEVKRISHIEVIPLDLSTRVRVSEGESINVNDYGWAVGLFANEIFGRKGDRRLPLINYRKGHFALNPTWAYVVESFEEEWEWFAFAAIAFLFWIGASIYMGSSTLRGIERQIQREIAQVLPGEAIPRRQEVAFIEEKLNTVKNQLQGLGSLASLSPLEALKELSVAIPADLDVVVDSVRIGNKEIGITGVVPEPRAIGRLETVLNARKDRFCEVRVESKARSSGAGKIAFEARIVLCE